LLNILGIGLKFLHIVKEKDLKNNKMDVPISYPSSHLVLI